MTVQGKLAGNTAERMKQTAVAGGTAVAEQAVITDKNILREIFQKMSMVPGLVEKLMARLPEHYREKLNAKDTTLGTIQLPFSVLDGTVRLPQINVATDSFRVTGAAACGLDQGAVAGNAVIAIDFI